MASISSSTGNALDVPSLVSQLMANERTPITKLNTKISTAQSKISNFGTIKSLVSTFQTSLRALSSSVAQFATTTSDSTAASASAGTTAAAGSYSIAVTTMAKAQSLVAAGKASSSTAITSGASTVTFVVGGTSKDVSIAAGASLEDIRSAINAASLGVTASIVNDGSGAPYRLSITADATGVSNAVTSITVKTGGDAALNDLLAFNPTENAPAPAVPMAEIRPASNAVLTINGISIVKASNTITDAVQGVTLTLSKESSTATITVARDSSAMVSAANDVVSSYNALVSKMKSLVAYADSTTGTAGGALAGDGTVKMMQGQLRDILTTATTGGTMAMLGEIGISVQATGSLALDSSTFRSKLSANYSDFVNLLTSSSGFATRLDTWATATIKVGGLIDSRTTSLSSSVTTMNTQIDQLENRMSVLQKQYTATYTKLNQLLNSMNSTSAYLTQQFASKSS